MFWKYIDKISYPYLTQEKSTEFLNKEVKLHATSSVLSCRVLCQLFTLAGNDMHKRENILFSQSQRHCFYR
jgi:hypothetical protein